VKQAASIYDVARDPKGLELAMAEILEEDFCSERVRGMMDAADEETELRVATSLPRRTLSPGYYKMAVYLFWLEARIKAGAFMPGGSAALSGLLAFEMEGVSQVVRARNEHQGKHPRCQGCGAAQDSRFSVECYSCRMKFRRDG
jgi:hypothetical protein